MKKNTYGWAKEGMRVRIIVPKGLKNNIGKIIHINGAYIGVEPDHQKYYYECYLNEIEPMNLLHKVRYDKKMKQAKKVWTKFLKKG